MLLLLLELLLLLLELLLLLLHVFNHELLRGREAPPWNSGINTCSGSIEAAAEAAAAAPAAAFVSELKEFDPK